MNAAVTTPTLVTYAAAVSRVLKVADGRLDYVNAEKDPVYGAYKTYKTCQYVNDDGTPSCIIGCAFAEEIKDLGIDAAHDLNSVGLTTLARDNGFQGRIQLTDKAFTFLSSLQMRQDRGDPWGQAIVGAVATTAADDTRRPFDDTRPRS